MPNRLHRVVLAGAVVSFGAVGIVFAASPGPPASPPTPAALWQEIQALQHGNAIMLDSHPFQPGSRVVDVYTTDLANAAANAAIKAAGSVPAVTRYPPGSLLVKENYDQARKRTGVTAELKVAGYDAADRNWVMAAYSPTGKVVAFGKVGSCIGCHAIVSKADFVFAPPPTQLLSVSVWKAFFPKQAMSAAYLDLLAKNPQAVVK